MKPTAASAKKKLGQSASTGSTIGDTSPANGSLPAARKTSRGSTTIGRVTQLTAGPTRR